MSTKKSIKVHPKYRRSQNQLLGLKDTFTIVPEIRISGKWLEEAGFSIGSSANIELHEQGITISKSPK
jgi:hypothetical protein